MKKKLLFSIAISLLTFLFMKVPVQAVDYYQYDQQQVATGGSSTIYSEYYRNQTFKPSMNVLTKVAVKLKNRNGGSITLTVKNENTGETVVTSSKRMGVGDGWTEFDLLGENLGYFLYTNHTYSIWLGTAYYAGDDVPAWFRVSDSNAYTNGTLRDGYTAGTGDFAFVTFGYTLDYGRAEPGDPIPDPEYVEPVQEDEPDVATPEDDTSTDTTTEDSVVVPDVSQKTEDVQTENIDESITPPELNSVLVDNVLVEIVEDENTETDNESEVKITGTATPGDKVVVMIGDNAYTATADENGNWYVIISTTDLEDGTYVVSAQSQDAQGKGSNKVKLFTLGVSEITEDGVTDIDTEEDTTLVTSIWNKINEGYGIYLFYIVAGLLFGGLVFLLIVLIRRKKKNKVENKI